MIDPTLAALLSDPDPVARAIAADLAHDCGEELLEAWLRTADSGFGWIGGDERTAMHGFAFGRGGIEIWERPSGRFGYHWIYRRKRWRWRCLDDDGRERWQSPPPGLETAVLAVLRRRLAEVSA